MVIYDLICKSCNAFAPDVYFPTLEKYETAKRACPTCKDGTLERAAAQLFNAGRKGSQTYELNNGDQLVVRKTPIAVTVPLAPCLDLVVSAGNLVHVRRRKDPRTN